MTRFLHNTLHVTGDYRAALGESPVWCDWSASLLWVDILAGKLLRYWPQIHKTEIQAMPRFTSAVLLTDSPDIFLIVSQSGIWRYEYRTMTRTLLCPWPEDEATTRPNESAIAPDGALWFSCMDPEAKRIAGSWYCLRQSNAPLQRMLSGLQVPNTLQWYEGYLWFADSLRQRFYCGQESALSLHIHQEYPIDGIADGSALTADGMLINARWGEAKLVCISLHQTQMMLTGEIPLPVTQPTSCTFGGPELNTLFITSAQDGLAQSGDSDGALLTIKTTHKGLPANRFRL